MCELIPHPLVDALHRLRAIRAGPFVNFAPSFYLYPNISHGNISLAHRIICVQIFQIQLQSRVRLRPKNGTVCKTALALSARGLHEQEISNNPI